MTSREFQQRLGSRIREAGLTMSHELADRLEAYFRLLALWNQKINLTALQLADPPPETIDRLLVEPLTAARYVPAGSAAMMDVGSGGGSPAIPLALALPHMRLTMVEAKTRKSVFLREAIRAVGLQSAEVQTARFEELATRQALHGAYDLVTVRAVRIDPAVLAALDVFLRAGAVLFLFRGVAEGPMDPPTSLRHTATYPLLDGDRSQLAILEKQAD